MADDREYPKGRMEDDEASGSPSLMAMVGQYTLLKQKYKSRQDELQKVIAVREGRMQEVYPSLFPTTGPFDTSIVANMIDVAARDLAEVLAPLPSFNCSPAQSGKDAAQKRAELRTKIAQSYLDFSAAQVQAYEAADDYFTAGYCVGMVELDMDEAMPRIMFYNAVGFYPVFNRWREITAGFFTFYKTKEELIHEYPHCASAMHLSGAGALIEVVRYHDENVDCLFLPTAGQSSMVLQSAKNPTGECLIEIAARPGLGDKPRGQFADVVAVQVAKSRFALLALEAATKAVQAPIVLPPDAQEMTFGPDALIRTSMGEKVRRVPIEVPQSAFAQQGMLDQELRAGARYPEARGGQVDGSVVTGRGVQALMSGFDTQIRTGQAMFARMWTNLIKKAFLADEKVFGDVKKSVTGNSQGTPYEVTYTPSIDIKGDYTVDVQYGLMAGLDPNRALVFGLQARGDKLISRTFLMEQMPFALNPMDEMKNIDIEEMRDALKQAVAGYAQAIPALASQGQDPGEVLARLGQIIEGRAKGESIESVVAKAFAPSEPPAQPGVEQSGAAMAPDGSAPPGAGGVPAGLSDATGQMRGIAPGQAGMGPGGSPDMQTLLAGLSASGKPNLSAAVKRNIPA